MSNHPEAVESSADAWERRATLAGEIDFTMMYVAHDAFNRDLARLLDAAETGRGGSREAAATWRTFDQQLRTHHAAEDSILWPRLLSAVTAPADREVLEAMEAEHASLDPALAKVDAAMKTRDAATLRNELKALAAGLAAHMIHEESEALPLLERVLGNPGWKAFSSEMRTQVGGMKGAGEYLPWVLDGATDQVKTSVLAVLPSPARVVYRTVWEPRYRKAARL